MARLGLKHTSEVTTRDKYTKVNLELGLVLDGKEIPNAAVLGSALEDAVKLVQDRITESYQVVPARQDAAPANTVVSLNENVVSEPTVVGGNATPGGLGFPPSR